MLTIPENEKLFKWVLAAFVGLCLLAIIAGCTPLDDARAVMAGPIPTPTATPAPSPTPPADTCTIKTGIPRGHLYLRSGSGTGNAVIKVLDEGETLTVNHPGEWLNVTDATGTQGFIYSRYCEKGK